MNFKKGDRVKVKGDYCRNKTGRILGHDECGYVLEFDNPTEGDSSMMPNNNSSEQDHWSYNALSHKSYSACYFSGQSLLLLDYKKANKEDD